MTNKTRAVKADNATAAVRVKQFRFELKSNGSVEKVGPFGCYGPEVKAATKSEAIAKFMQFAFRAVQNTPTVKVKNGAYQLAYESLNYGLTVESGIEGRQHPLCFSGVSNWSSLNDTIAGFDYYSSSAYIDANKAA